MAVTLEKKTMGRKAKDYRTTQSRVPDVTVDKLKLLAGLHRCDIPDLYMNVINHFLDKEIEKAIKKEAEKKGR